MKKSLFILMIIIPLFVFADNLENITIKVNYIINVTDSTTDMNSMKYTTHWSTIIIYVKKGSYNEHIFRNAYYTEYKDKTFVYTNEVMFQFYTDNINYIKFKE